MKTNHHFKLSGNFKNLLAGLPFKDKHERGHFKRMLIEAQVESMKKPSKDKE